MVVCAITRMPILHSNPMTLTQMDVACLAFINVLPAISERVSNELVIVDSHVSCVAVWAFGLDGLCVVPPMLLMP